MSRLVSAEGRVILRPWSHGDEAALAHHASNPKIAINLRDRFPNPYTLEDAREWIAVCQGQERDGRTLSFAIEVQGEPVGGIGLMPGTDIHRISAEVGYWLSEEYWGQGLAAEALRTMVAYASEKLSLTRLYAGVFAWNPASTRVLEKAGFEFEVRTRCSAIKGGRVVDELYYSRLLLETL